MQNGHRWIIAEKTTRRWVRSVDGPPVKVGFADDMSEALRYGTRFRAEDDATYLSHAARAKRGGESIKGMLFEVYEFDDSDRSRQVLPYLVFTPNTKEGKA